MENTAGIMFFDPEAGEYVFELVVGCKVDGELLNSRPCLIQADDPDEAEEKVLEYLADLDLGQRFWLEEVSDPCSLEEYLKEVEENDRKMYPILDELTEEEFTDFMGL